MLDIGWLVVVVEKGMKRTLLYITGITAFGSKLYTAGISKFWLNCVVLEKIQFLSLQ